MRSKTRDKRLDSAQTLKSQLADDLSEQDKAREAETACSEKLRKASMTWLDTSVGQLLRKVIQAILHPGYGFGEVLGRLQASEDLKQAMDDPGEVKDFLDKLTDMIELNREYVEHDRKIENARNQEKDTQRKLNQVNTALRETHQKHGIVPVVIRFDDRPRHKSVKMTYITYTNHSFRAQQRSVTVGKHRQETLTQGKKCQEDLRKKLAERIRNNLW